MDQHELQRANRRAAWRWGSLVVGLLGLQVIGGVIAIILATGDESVAVVPNYHEKALRWDQEIADQAASQALGWNCAVESIDALPAAGLRVMVTDRGGLPVTVESGELRFYRHVRASDVQRVAIPSGKFDAFELGGCFDAPGLWQVMLELRLENGAKFLHSQELFVAQSNDPQTLDRDRGK